MSKTTGSATSRRVELRHLAGCPAARIETTHHDNGVTTVHCLDCGAHYPDDPDNVGPFATRRAA